MPLCRRQKRKPKAGRSCVGGLKPAAGSCAARTKRAGQSQLSDHERVCTKRPPEASPRLVNRSAVEAAPQHAARDALAGGKPVVAHLEQRQLGVRQRACAGAQGDGVLRGRSPASRRAAGWCGPADDGVAGFAEFGARRAHPGAAAGILQRQQASTATARPRCGTRSRCATGEARPCRRRRRSRPCARQPCRAGSSRWPGCRRTSDSGRP